MSLSSVFATTVSTKDLTSGHLGDQAHDNTTTASDFITVQSLANFAVMAGAITAAWGGASSLSATFNGRWFPFVLCAVFGLVSVLTVAGAGKPTDDAARIRPVQSWSAGLADGIKKWTSPSFIALVNVFVLYSAVLGAGAATHLA